MPELSPMEKTEITMESLKGKNPQEIDTMIQGGLLDKLLKVPGNADAIYNLQMNYKPPEPAPKPEEKKPEPTPAPAGAVPEPKSEENKAPQGGEPPKKWGDYDTPEKMFEALQKKEESEKRLRELYDKTRGQVDTSNAERGAIYDQLKAEREEKDRLRKEKEELDKQIAELQTVKTKVPELVLPQMPKEQEELVDPNSDFWKSMRKFNEDVASNHTLSQKEILKLEGEKRQLMKDISDLKNGMGDIQNRETRREAETVEAEYADRMNYLYSEIETLQKGYPELATGIPFRTINDGANKDAEYLKTISADDAVKFAKIRDLVSKQFGYFEPKVTKDGKSFPIFKKYPSIENLNECYLLQLNRTGELSKRFTDQQRQGTEKTITQTLNPPVIGGATQIPASVTGGPVSLEYGSMSDGDMHKRIWELQAKWEAKTMSAVERNEMNRLLLAVGMGDAIPKNELKELYNKPKT